MSGRDHRHDALEARVAALEQQIADIRQEQRHGRDPSYSCGRDAMYGDCPLCHEARRP